MLAIIRVPAERQFYSDDDCKSLRHGSEQITKPYCGWPAMSCKGMMNLA